MKRFKNTIILLLMFLSACSTSLDYQIERKFESLVNNENCQIEFYYPIFVSTNSNVSTAKLNDLLKRYPDHKYYTHRCNESRREKTVIKGDFSVLLQADDKLSVEFTTLIVSFFGNIMDTVYHSLVINPKRLTEKDLSFTSIEPESLLRNFDRGVLKKYVENFNKTHHQDVNLLAYETGSRYDITWGLTENKFVLYVGGEGEAFGYDKIEIPLEEIKGR